MASINNALSGASTGASIGGSVLPGWGHAIGAGLGSLAGLFGSDSNGIKALNPQQQKIQDLAGSQALQLLQGGRPQGFQPIADRAQRQFTTQTVPGLAERFSSLGAGSQNSSAFQGALGQAGSDLQSQLAALESQFGQNQLSQLLNAGLGSIDTTQQPTDMFDKLGADSLSALIDYLKGYMNSNASGGGTTGSTSANSNLENIFSNIYKDNISNQPGIPGYNYSGMNTGYNLGGRPL